MNREAPGRRFSVLSLCCAVLSTMLAVRSLSAESPRTITGTEIDQSVTASLSSQDITKTAVVSHIDLTKPFETEDQWTFVAVQRDDQPPSDIEGKGSILICFVRGSKPDCAEQLYQKVKGWSSEFSQPHHLLASNIVYVGPNRSSPLLLVKVCGVEGGDGDCGIATALYKYDKQADRFIRVFLNVTGRNNNQVTRFVERGPLQGDIIVAYPTENAPYTYWVEVYRQGKSSQYVQILRYRGRTAYSDGNPLAVSDSEIPAILQRLGLWKSGDPLPIPAHLPKGCSKVFMRNGEEWCK